MQTNNKKRGFLRRLCSEPVLLALLCCAPIIFAGAVSIHYFENVGNLILGCFFLAVGVVIFGIVAASQIFFDL